MHRPAGMALPPFGYCISTHSPAPPESCSGTLLGLAGVRNPPVVYGFICHPTRTFNTSKGVKISKWPWGFEVFFFLSKYMLSLSLGQAPGQELRCSKTLMKGAVSREINSHQAENMGTTLLICSLLSWSAGFAETNAS